MNKVKKVKFLEEDWSTEEIDEISRCISEKTKYHPSVIRWVGDGYLLEMREEKEADKKKRFFFSDGD